MAQVQKLCPNWNPNPVLPIQVLLHNKKAATTGYIKFSCRTEDWEMQKEEFR